MLKLKCLFVLCVAFAVVGCAHNMPLAKGQTSIDLSKHTIALLSVKVSNQHKPEYQPNRLLVFVGGAAHLVDDIYKSEKNGFNEYLVNFDLKPGTNRFDKIWFIYRGTFTAGHASVPLGVETEIKGGSVTYLGHMNLVIRAKNDGNEPNAGPVIPLIDQAVTGFSTGTYDLVIEDRFDEDMKSFISEYPGLERVMVEKSVLPQQTRRESRNSE
jgi:hypothetical protein